MRKISTALVLVCMLVLTSCATLGTLKHTENRSDLSPSDWMDLIDADARDVVATARFGCEIAPKGSEKCLAKVQRAAEIYGELYARAGKWVPVLEQAIETGDALKEKEARDALISLAEDLPPEFFSVKGKILDLLRPR